MEWPKELPSVTEVLTMLGIGGGSGLLGKKWTDREQDKKIKALDNRLSNTEGLVNKHEKRKTNFKN